jgi:hypothetical protein
MTAMLEGWITIKSRRNGRPRTSKRGRVTVIVDRVLVGKARLVGAHRGMTVAELLTELLRGTLDQAYQQMVRELREGP